MAKVKARCPACSAAMKAKANYCTGCGKANPLFAPKAGPAAKAGRPALVKSARPATVTEIRRGQLLREIYAEPNPERREVFTGQLTDMTRGGAA